MWNPARSELQVPIVGPETFDSNRVPSTSGQTVRFARRGRRASFRLDSVEDLPTSRTTRLGTSMILAWSGDRRAEDGDQRILTLGGVATISTYLCSR